MGHCVGNYSCQAQQGQCYLFHVEWKGESATAEVDKNGRLVQVKGPHNKENLATKYGKTILTKWGKKFNNENSNVETDAVETEIPENILDNLPF